MNRNILWAHWRLPYVTGSHREDACIFCSKPAQHQDRDHLIVYRFATGYVILNAFPYNNGHLMVVPYRHAPRLRDLADGELGDLMTTTKICEEVLTEAFKPHGFNIGLNLGRCAGAGIDAHLHIHIVPRWDGDTNFMTVLGDTRVLPELLFQTYDRLRPLFERYEKERGCR